MKNGSVKWNKLFLFCMGLFVAASFAMKWMESDLLYNGNTISILGLELYYPAKKIEEIFSGLMPQVKTILGYHLIFDFIFMAGCFPGIACLCMIAREKVSGGKFKILLIVFAFLQLIAWAFDIVENYYLLKWLETPVIGNEFEFYHLVVYTKWGIAITGTVLSLGTITFTGIKKFIMK